jgi:hypothetical protein
MHCNPAQEFQPWISARDFDNLIPLAMAFGQTAWYFPM